MEYELHRDVAFRCLDKWMSNRENGKFFSDYLVFKGIKTIGIYGYGLMGKHLLSELKDSDIDVLWIMDKKELDIPFRSVHIEDAEQLEKPDLVIITPINGYEEMEVQLRKKGYEKIRGLVEIVEVMNTWNS